MTSTMFDCGDDDNFLKCCVHFESDVKGKTTFDEFYCFIGSEYIFNIVRQAFVSF